MDTTESTTGTFTWHVYAERSMMRSFTHMVGCWPHEHGKDFRREIRLSAPINQDAQYVMSDASQRFVDTLVDRDDMDGALGGFMWTPTDWTSVGPQEDENSTVTFDPMDWEFVRTEDGSEVQAQHYGTGRIARAPFVPPVLA